MARKQVARQGKQMQYVSGSGSSPLFSPRPRGRSDATRVESNQQAFRNAAVRQAGRTARARQAPPRRPSR